MINETEFKEMFLLFDELVKKEIAHYVICHPREINAYQVGGWDAPGKVAKNFHIIYGSEKAREFLEEMKKRETKEQL